MIFTIDVEQIENCPIHGDGVTDWIDVGLADGITQECSDLGRSLCARAWHECE